MGALVLLVPLILAGLIAIGIYNSLIGKKNRVDEAFAGIDAQLKKRYDLIPNLVAAVKTYMAHEANVLTEVTALRARAASGNLAPNERVAVENELQRGIGRIRLVAEAYPDLKASKNFMHLQGSLNEVEEQLSASRRAYNAAVKELNDAIEMFPSSLFAGMMSLTRRAFFETPEAERANVSVKNLFAN